MSEHAGRGVELVRVPRQEQVFDRESILGRDSSSVFPTESKQAASEATEALKAKLGANRFITETEVLELQKQHGAAEEEAYKNNKPLAQVLAEAKQAKEDAFQNQWKQMKQGKNRPLDEEEIQFVDAVEAANRQREEQDRQQEQQALGAFQLAVAAAAEAKQASAIGPALPPNAKAVGPKKPSVSEKPAKPKSMIAIRKHARQPSADAGAEADARRKQARLTREGADKVFSSLAVPSKDSENSLLPSTTGRTQNSGALPHATEATDQQNAPLEGQKQHQTASFALEREGQDPVATSLPLPESSKSLAGFLADYGSGTDSDT